MFVAVEDIADVTENVLLTELVVSHVDVILWTQSKQQQHPANDDSALKP